MSENASPVVVHRLLKKDLTTLTGECSECGFVAIAKAGNGFQCAVKKKAGQKAWSQQNPEKARANRRQRSSHELFNRDYVALTASCAVCGPVVMTPWGRGYACATRAAELRTSQESAPNAACRECWIIDGDRVYLTDGVCPRCSDPRLTDTGAALADAERRAGQLEGLGSGMTVVDLETDDPYFIPEYEAAVPGWKTVGSSRPWNEV